MDPSERRLVDACVALVERRRAAAGRALLVRRAAVADEVLRAREHRARRAQVRRLEAADRGHAELGDDRGVLGEALVRAAPALVARHREARRERPLRAGRAHLERGHARRGLDERGVARAAQADVVREKRRAFDVAVAVHRVDAVQDRDLEPRVQAQRDRVVDRARPIAEAVAGRRVRVAAAQHRAQEIAPRNGARNGDC